MDTYLAEKFGAYQIRRDQEVFKSAAWEKFDAQMTTIYDIQVFIKFRMRKSQLDIKAP